MNDFQLYKANAAFGKDYPYLLDVQSPLLRDLRTRLVIPLTRKPQRNIQISQLNPEIVIGEDVYLVLTQQMAAIPAAYLGEQLLEVHVDRAEILSAIDFLITGFRGHPAQAGL